MLDAILKLIETVKVKVKEINIGSNRKVEIETIDQSKHLHYHAEIGLSAKEIINLSDEDVGKLVRQQAYLQLKAVGKDYPEAMRRLEAIFTASAITTGTAAITVRSLNSQNKLLPSGDFIRQLPIVMNDIVVPVEPQNIQTQLPTPTVVITSKKAE